MSSTRTFSRTALTGIVLLACVAAGVVAGRWSVPEMSAGRVFANMSAPETASRGKSLSLATGFVDLNEGVEALYGLDHLTGDLHCWLLHSQTGAVAATFTASPGRDLEVTADADYVMVTGLMDFVGTAGNVRPSHSVVFVGDGNTGNVVGYVLMYNRGALQRGEHGTGELRKISQMVTRDVNRIRDQGK